ncbi:MAG: CPBP family intramembrane metalloprotease [Acidobacteria bacterium]|nr:CPBP family intramembrane metalloprotease [Acidobacteriota bacterium]MBV9478713.1 CPBP family intramembrane metalloprotease [Acidobacteriota bacterium]
MLPYVFSVSLVLIAWLAVVTLNETRGLLRCDRFPNDVVKWIAYVWLGAFMLLLATLVTGAARHPATTKQLASTPFYQVFALHALLVIFLLGWWLMTNRPPLREFLNIRHERPAEVVAIGVSVGVGGWIVTLMLALLIALILRFAGALDEQAQPPAMIGFMAAMPLWKKALIVLSAMTIEEAFFRSFLQKRIGLIASTLLFALAHFTYGNPLLLIGVAIISLIIGFTFYRTKNVLPGVIAHGVFDAVQLFIIVPIAYRMIGAGA